MGDIEQDVTGPNKEAVVTNQLRTWEDVFAARGMQQGMQKGMEKGRQEERVAFVRRMLKARIDKTQIQEISGLSADEIEKISAA